MEQIPFDDPQDAAIADNVLQHLRHSLVRCAPFYGNKIDRCIFVKYAEIDEL